ncbi:error-prone DNA polymerase [Agarilytica rhodophyticola]|uniref:error-prone DNA polymerase n=1 Tax=Agarilytica rhodophyticola TaxID=1737490 RepID=UPI000B341A49|nr:error-prone DNA polymerase [Agarilytica rhodophyticola]
MQYNHLYTITNYSFLTGASHPHELVSEASKLGYASIAITDECSLAGIVKAHISAKEQGIKLIVGSVFTLSNSCKIIVIAPNKKAYHELSGFITLARRRSKKGSYQAHFEDLRFRLQHCFIIWVADQTLENKEQYASTLLRAFKERLWIGIDFQFTSNEQASFLQWQNISQRYRIPLLACQCVVMHDKLRKPLHDVLCGIKHNTSIDKLGRKLSSNAEAHLKDIESLSNIYPQALIEEADKLAKRCVFSMDDLRYQYPHELVPKNKSAIEYLTEQVYLGANKRWPNGIPELIQKAIKKELSLIAELHYEFYFLTVYDIVKFARSRDILCQGRGSAANSVVCYCLYITEISPEQINVLFERFISKERNQPPDIDVDFEHERREEVIQYIYQKYSRKRAAIAATVITYRSRSAVRDVGKAMGLDPSLIDHLAKSLAWWDRKRELLKRIEEAGFSNTNATLLQFFTLVQDILGFPKHLSQHVGGFVITQSKISDLVPLENASMEDRTVIQWDKDDLEAMGLLKVDILSLGMLTALRKTLSYVNQYQSNLKTIADIPKEDPATYAMLSRGDSIGVFQVESRAQISMLPRLKPVCFYDLVIEIAIVRPGPVQGGMVHPYLRRRDNLEPIVYHNEAIKEVLSSTKGIPIFQEQAIRLAMVAAGFSGGEADQLRRAMATWGKNGNLLQFENKFIKGMLDNGYDADFANRLFNQIKGFGGYGFPESHSASFALLCYLSSWLKCHHPAAFYCALLNSQPMGFYSPSQLIQDAKRHGIKIFPIDINTSVYQNKIERKVNTGGKNACDWGLRLGFCNIKALPEKKAILIERYRTQTPFKDVEDLAKRTSLTQIEIQCLAAADALYNISGHRYSAHWQASAVKQYRPLLTSNERLENADMLTTSRPKLEGEVLLDLKTTGLSLRPHPLALLRQKYPFSRCKKYCELPYMSNGRFVRVAGLVTGRQRPGSAKGTIFVTLEDETGNINIIVWKSVQERFRQTLLSAKLILVKGHVETKDTVVHIIAGELQDLSNNLQNLTLKSRDFH